MAAVAVFGSSCALLTDAAKADDPQQTPSKLTEHVVVAPELDDKPSVMLLAAPAKNPETVSFSSLPEPVVAGFDNALLAAPPMVQPETTQTLLATRLPEPHVPPAPQREPRLPPASALERSRSDPPASTAAATGKAASAVAATGESVDEAAASVTATGEHADEAATSVAATGEPVDKTASTVVAEPASSINPAAPAAATAAAATPDGTRADAGTSSATAAGATTSGEMAPDAGTSSATATGTATSGGIAEIAAIESETVTISLDGRGWIYTPADISEKEVSLLKRTITRESTIFEFYPAAAGEYALRFQFQDNSTGSTTIEQIMLKVYGDPDPEAIGGESIANLVEKSADKSAEKSTGQPETMQTTARAAVPQNLSQALENPQAAASVLSRILSGAGASDSDRQMLDRIARLYKDTGKTNEYAMCLERYLELFPYNSGNDYRYFELGRLYETEELRNEKKARESYAAVVKRYPASLYYLDAAARVRYLDRHFFDLR